MYWWPYPARTVWTERSMKAEDTLLRYWRSAGPPIWPHQSTSDAPKCPADDARDRVGQQSRRGGRPAVGPIGPALAARSRNSGRWAATRRRDAGRPPDAIDVPTDGAAQSYLPAEICAPTSLTPPPPKRPNIDFASGGHHQARRCRRDGHGDSCGCSSCRT